MIFICMPTIKLLLWVFNFQLTLVINYRNNLGETILYQWIEKVREVLQSWQSSDDTMQNVSRSINEGTTSNV